MSIPNIIKMALLSHIMDFLALKEYKLADEIQRIESLSREDLVRELVQLTSERIESLPDEALLVQV